MVDHFTPYNRNGYYGFIKEVYFAGKGTANDGYDLGTQKLLQFHNFEEPCPGIYKKKTILKICCDSEYYGTNNTHSLVTGEAVEYTMRHYYTDGWYIYYALGSEDTNTGPTNFTHTIVPEYTGILPSIAIFRQYNNTISASIYIMKMIGAQVESYEFAWEYNRPIVETIKFRGADADFGITGSVFGHTTRPYTCPVLAADNLPALSDLNDIYHGGLGIITMTGTPFATLDDKDDTTCTKKYTLMAGRFLIQNELMDLQTLGSDRYKTVATNRICTGRTISCEIEVLCADATALQDFNDWYAQTDTTSVLTVAFTQTAGTNSITWAFQKIKCESIDEVEGSPLRVRMVFYPQDSKTTTTSALTVTVIDQVNQFDSDWYPYTVGD